MSNEYQLEMNNISKHFGGVKALENVTFNLKKGEVHALTGENGAGKSTLMKVLSGAHKKDNGFINIDGKQAKIACPKDAIELGIAVIYQEFMLAPDLTVAENIYIDRLSSDSKFINWSKLRKDAKKELSKLGFDDIDPNARVGTLSIAYQQVVEICKSLTRNAKVLVLDEPTAVLTTREIKKLFNVINDLKQQGISIVYISHRLEEIFEMCDRITVLKDGQTVDTVNTEDINKEKLVNLMIGRELTQLYPERDCEIKEEVLKVTNLSAGELVKNVSFSVRSGEVLGFTGLVGSGRTETMRAIFGIDKKSSGKIEYLGKQVNFKNARTSIENGLGFLPEDRKVQGLLLEQSIRINTTIAQMKKFSKFGFINHKKEKLYVKELLDSMSTKYHSTEDNASSMSGGNQQKVSLAKWLVGDCKCLILDEPTRGVDVGAKKEIYTIINALAEKGVSIIVISSEMSEIIGVCDRALVMKNGQISGEVAKEDLSEEVLIKYAMGV